jgi:hypothetical protein
MTIFGFWLLGSSEKKNEDQLGFHMRYHSFVHYGWFLQACSPNLHPTYVKQNKHLKGQLISKWPVHFIFRLFL